MNLAAATRLPAAPAPRASSERVSDIALMLSLATLAALHLANAYFRVINWDEFWFYSQVETLARGDYLQPLQTIHTRAFYWWLPGLGGTEVEHIVIARFFMAACLAVAAFATYLAARALVERPAAILAIAAYLGSGFVLNHGTSFRIDPIAAATLSSALALALRVRLTPVAIAALGILIALSAMVTIKFVLWAPAFAGVALYRWEQERFERTYPLRWFAAGAVAAAVFAVLYALHSVPAPEAQRAMDPANYASGSASKMFGLLHSPYLYMMRHAAIFGLPLAVAAIAAPYLIVTGVGSRTRRLALLLLWTPALTPLFYHNSAPYFYVFILPPVVVASSLGFEWVAKRYGAATVAALIGLFSLLVWVGGERSVKHRQQELLLAVHQAVPEPVAYFDCCGMIGSFRKANGFMTPWGLESYQRSGRAKYRAAMEKQPVPLLLDNEQYFRPIFEGGAPARLHPDDRAALTQTYRPFWGDLYIAGRELPSGYDGEWDVLVPGPYTVSGRVSVAGKEYREGAIVDLLRGPVALSNPSSKPASLTWGRALEAPTSPPPSDYWGGF
ncbi:hypothetical protein [Erythrobacter sp.]|jgi:hypothetical protein|uniref:hypothetical protein n=1 Tax=Erythrobacter sp. TaxID=1042 RepID=UPI002EB72487|nr:hypothetical protein [Erythrobacter sp.]